MREGNGMASRRRRGVVARRTLVLATAAIITGLTAGSAGAQDTTPPFTSISGPIGLTRDNQPIFNLSSSEAGSTFNCKLDAFALLPCGPASYQPPQPLAEGPHTLLAYATDPAGNTDPTGVGIEFIVDPSIAGAHLAAPRRQKVSPRKLEINVELRGQEALTVRVSGVVRIGERELATRPIKRRLGGRPSIRPVLTATRRVERAVTGALERGGRVEVEVSARFRDEVGNEELKERTIVLR